MSTDCYVVDGTVNPLIIKAGCKFGPFSENQPEIRKQTWYSLLHLMFFSVHCHYQSLPWCLLHHISGCSFNVMSIFTIIWLRRSHGHIPQAFCPCQQHPGSLAAPMKCQVPSCSFSAMCSPRCSSHRMKSECTLTVSSCSVPRGVPVFSGGLRTAAAMCRACFKQRFM